MIGAAVEKAYVSQGPLSCVADQCEIMIFRLSLYHMIVM